MARSRANSSDQPVPEKGTFGLLRALGSLRLAVVLIGTFAILLAWATFVENRYGVEAVKFGIYGTWWFATLGALLALNIFSAALVRFPWKKQQTGFLTTHLGLLVMAAGFLLSRTGGIDANLPIFEGRANWRAFEDSQHFAMSILPEEDSNAADDDTPSSKSIIVPFASGPFNWEDYAALPPFPWWLAIRDRGVLYDRDGVKLEVLDYYADSKKAPAPRIELRFNTRSASPRGLSDSAPIPVRLQVESDADPHSPGRRFGMGQRHTMPSGVRVVFWMTGSEAESEAFRRSQPDGPLGKLGRIVLHAGGNPFQFAVDDLREGQRMALAQTGLELEFVRFDPRFFAVQLMIHGGGEPPRRMILFADLPEYTQHDYAGGVFGTFWYDAAQRPETDEQQINERMLDAASAPRIDVLQGADQRLYYRTWHSPKLGTIAKLPGDDKQDGDEQVLAFGGSDAEVEFYVVEFVPRDRPGMTVTPAPFNKKKGHASRERQARVRLTVDGNAEEFWIEGMPSDPIPIPPADGQQKVIEGKGRRVAITMPPDEIDVGFRLFLHEFNRKLDPGTSQASHYSSLVDFVDRDNPNKVLQERVLITLNAPQDFSDPSTGRSYRLFQHSFAGPWRPGHPMFQQIVGDDDARDQLFLSWLTVNYDPGRGLKYLGSLLIVAGIVIMYYMKAYFFAGRKR